jgi:small subunit ribosomal protein S21
LLDKTIIFTFAAHFKTGNAHMIIVPVKEGESIDKALKKYKRKFEKTGVMRELRERKAFKKPSIRRREEVNKAIYVQQLNINKD